MADRVNWKAFAIVWAIAISFILVLASGSFGAPAPFTCEQVQAFVHGKTQEQLQAVLAGMDAHERAAAAQCLKKPTAKSAKPHAVHPVQPVQPAVVPIALPAPVVVQPVRPVQPAAAPFVCTHQQAEAGECSPQTVAVSPAPKPKPKKKGFIIMIEIVLGAAGTIATYFVFKFGIVKVVQKVLSWWAARKLVPTTQMLLDAHAAFEARLTELEDRFKPASEPVTGLAQQAPATVVINEAAHGDAPAAEPVKV